MFNDKKIKKEVGEEKEVKKVMVEKKEVKSDGKTPVELLSTNRPH